MAREIVQGRNSRNSRVSSSGSLAGPSIGTVSIVAAFLVPWTSSGALRAFRFVRPFRPWVQGKDKASSAVASFSPAEYEI